LISCARLAVYDAVSRPVNSGVRFLFFMKPNKLEHRKKFLVRWSPAFFIVSLGLLAGTLFRAPVSASYVGFVILISLIYTVIAIIDWNRNSGFLPIFGTMVVVIGELAVREHFFPNASGWTRPMQFVSILFTVFFGVLAIFRLSKSKYLEND
jgi:hypothetical protein